MWKIKHDGIYQLTITDVHSISSTNGELVKPELPNILSLRTGKLWVMETIDCFQRIRMTLR